MTSIHDLADQAEWEMEGVRRAVVRYEEAEADALRAGEAMALPPGKALIKGVIGLLIARIVELQNEATDIAQANSRLKPHAWHIQVIDPTKAAVITLSAACSATTRPSGAMGSGGSQDALPAVAKRISAGLRDQLEYDRWEAAEEQRNKEAKRSKVEGHQDRLKALKLRYPDLSRRAWHRWRQKLELARETWTELEEVAVGTALLKALADVAPDRFLIAERPINGGVQYFLDTTPAVREVMADVRERAMVSRPLLMPMICPPIPWRYE